MAVNLSPIGGVAGQFFDNNGNPLAGGKIFTYAAGTTTNQATYTSASGVIAHSNPIILDAAGRVPSGEIWLTDGLQYKFVIKTSLDVLIGTYDNIIGINSNFINFLTETEIQTATAGQTVFTLTTMDYQPGTNSLSVFVDGVNQYDGVTYAYTETSSTVVTFTAGLHVGALVKFTTAQTLSSGVTDASLVTYNEGSINAVDTTVQAKLRETVSVKDFGAVGNGVADDTAAFANAITASKSIFIPEGTYLVDSVLITGDGYNIQGASPTDTIIKARTSSTTDLFSIVGGPSYATNNTVKNLMLDMSNMTDISASHGLNLQFLYDCNFEQINVIGNGSNKRTLYTSSDGSGGGVYTTVFTNCNFSSVTGTIELTGASLSDATTTLTFVGCSFGRCIANNCFSITFLQPIVQGTLNKFELSEILGFSIIGGDIEGTGTYLVFGANVKHFSSINNEFAGFTGTYSTGTFEGGLAFDCRGSVPFLIKPVNGILVPTLHDGTITEQTSGATLLRKTIQNTNATGFGVDTQYKNANGSTFVGQNAAGDSVVDARGTGKVTFQQSGTNVLGVTASNLMLIGTATSASASAGTSGAPPATVQGYIRMTDGNGVEIGKIPYYAT